MRVVRSAVMVGLMAALGSLGTQGADAAKSTTVKSTVAQAAAKTTTTPPSTKPATTPPSTKATTKRTTPVNTTKPTTKPNGNGSTQAHHAHTVMGIVEHVNHQEGRIRIKLHHSGSQGGQHHEEVFHVNSSTKFVKVHGQQHHTVHFKDVHHGEHVVIHHHSNQAHLASEVDIMVHGHNSPTNGSTTTAKTKTNTAKTSVAVR